MKYIKLFEYFSQDYHNFDDGLINLLENQKAHIETWTTRSGKITAIKVVIENIWDGYFYTKNDKGVTRFKEMNTNKMGTLVNSQKSNNLVILDLKYDDNTTKKLSIKLIDTDCNIPKSKYIPQGKDIESIKTIQRALSQVDGGKYKKILGNFGPNKDGIDGQYGCSTLGAIIQFQRDNNIKPSDGVYGPITSEVLSKKLGDHIPPHGVQKREKLDDFITLKPISPTKVEKTS